MANAGSPDLPLHRKAERNESDSTPSPTQSSVKSEHADTQSVADNSTTRRQSRKSQTKAACDFCRRRKVSCEFNKGSTCKSCTKYGIICSFLNSQPPKGSETKRKDRIGPSRSDRMLSIDTSAKAMANAQSRVSSTRHKKSLDDSSGKPKPAKVAHIRSQSFNDAFAKPQAVSGAEQMTLNPLLVNVHAVDTISPQALHPSSLDLALLDRRSAQFTMLPPHSESATPNSFTPDSPMFGNALTEPTVYSPEAISASSQPDWRLFAMNHTNQASPITAESMISPIYSTPAYQTSIDNPVMIENPVTFNALDNSGTFPAPSPTSSTATSFAPLPSPATTSKTLTNQVEPSRNLHPSVNTGALNAQIVGLSGSTDPFLLSKLRYDDNDEAEFQSLRIRKVHQGALTNQGIPVMFVIPGNGVLPETRNLEALSEIRSIRDEIEQDIPEPLGKQLIRYFFKHIHPFFPVLTNDPEKFVLDPDGYRVPDSFPTCILAAMYGLTLALGKANGTYFLDFDRDLAGLAAAMFTKAWAACSSLLHTPNLPITQALLLLTQRQPTPGECIDIPNPWLLISMAVASAESLGLTRDPRSLNLPPWELRLRRRIAWSLFVQESWLALTLGRPSHINPEDCNLQPLTQQDLCDVDSPYEHRSCLTKMHFIGLCNLTVLVSEVSRTFYRLNIPQTLKDSLEARLNVALPLLVQIETWRQQLPPDLLAGREQTRIGHNKSPLNPPPESINGNASLELAYLAAKAEIFCALLRPHPLDKTSARVNDTRRSARVLASAIVEFAGRLNPSHRRAFWPGYAGSNFAICSTFMLLLLATSSRRPELEECISTLDSWQAVLRDRSGTNDIEQLAQATLRLTFSDPALGSPVHSPARAVKKPVPIAPKQAPGKPASGIVRS